MIVDDNDDDVDCYYERLTEEGMTDWIIGAEVSTYGPADRECVKGGQVSYASAAEG